MPDAQIFALLRTLDCAPATFGFTVLRMTTQSDTRPGALLARARWDRPENVARRVERLAAEIAKLPTLTREQRAQLTGAVKAVR